MYVGEFEDITQLNREVTRRLVYGKPDVINATDTQLHDVLVRAESSAFDFDLKNVWLTENRWNALVAQYLDPTALNLWLKLIEEKLDGPRKRGVAFLRTQNVKTQTNATTGREWRRWGSCLLGFSYRARPQPQIALHSRTTYLGYIAQIDLALASILARTIAERLKIVEGQDAIAFTWHLEAGQFHAFKSLAWFYADPNDRRKIEGVTATPALKKKYPTLYLARRTLEKFEQEDAEGKGYGDHNFNQMLRIRRRWHAEVFDEGYGDQFHHGTSGSTSKRNHSPYAPLPATPITRLGLDAILKRTAGDADNAGFIDLEDEDV